MFVAESGLPGSGSSEESNRTGGTDRDDLRAGFEAMPAKVIFVRL
jgi:hypothetical protein